MNNINFALIGCGNISRKHITEISKHGKLIAICDTEESKLNSIKLESFTPNKYTCIDEMLEVEKKLNIVAISTPNGLHAEQSIKCLNNGLHVICEKPMSLSSTDCGRMINASEKNNKRLFIVKQNRFNPPISALKSLLNDNILGKIYSVQLTCIWNRDISYYNNSWRGTLNLDGGILFTQFSHFIDIVYWLFGDFHVDCAKFNNYHHRGSIEFEDTAVVLASFMNGAIGTLNFSINSFEKNMEGSLTVIGENGTIKIGGEYLNKIEYQRIKNYSFTSTDYSRPANNYGSYIGSMSNHDLVYENVLDVLNNGASINTSNFEAFKTVEIIERIYRFSPFRKML